VSSLSSRFGVSLRRQRAQVQSGGRVSAFGLDIAVRACLCLVTLVLAYARLADMQALLLVRVSSARRNGSTSDSACLRCIWMCAEVSECLFCACSCLARDLCAVAGACLPASIVLNCQVQRPKDRCKEGRRGSYDPLRHQLRASAQGEAPSMERPLS